MSCAVVGVGLHAGLDAVEGKGGDGGQDAGARGSDLGAIALYPAARLFFANTGDTVLLRHGASPEGSSGDILEAGLSGHGSRSAGGVLREMSFRQWPRDEGQSHRRGRDTVASAANKKGAIKIPN